MATVEQVHAIDDAAGSDYERWCSSSLSPGCCSVSFERDQLHLTCSSDEMSHSAVVASTATDRPVPIRRPEP
ncbi:MAG: hypothetical protein ACLQAN_00680 [Acidimicrobiales bacterium]